MASLELSAAAASRIMKEVRSLMKSPLKDFIVHVSDDDVSELQFVMQGPESTPFEDGEFEFKLQFTCDFPEIPPKGYFITRLFHPNVAPETGEICVNTLKRAWRSDFGLRHILQSIRSLMIVPNPDSALNAEAGKLLNDSYEEFQTRARLFTQIYALPSRPVFARKRKAVPSRDSESDGCVGVAATTSSEGKRSKSKKKKKSKRRKMSKKKDSMGSMKASMRRL